MEDSYILDIVNKIKFEIPSHQILYFCSDDKSAHPDSHGDVQQLLGVGLPHVWKEKPFTLTT